MTLKSENDKKNEEDDKHQTCSTKTRTGDQAEGKADAADDDTQLLQLQLLLHQHFLHFLHFHWSNACGSYYTDKDLERGASRETSR